MKASLYELTSDLEELMEMAVQDDLPYEQWKMIHEEIMKLIENKSENTIKYIRNLKGRIEMSKTEEERLKTFRQSQEKKVKKLEDYMIYCLQKADIKKIETGIGNISLRKSPVSVEVDMSCLPKKYMTKETVYKVDKKALKELMLDGTSIKGARLIDDKYGLSVK